MTSKNLAKLWAVEYENSGIPSSFRAEPSGAVRDFVEFLTPARIEGAVAADLGCGKGRNSLFLARMGCHVYAMDLVESNVEHLAREAEEESLSSQISARQADLNKTWPIESSSVDVAIDTFVYKHQAEDGQPERYRQELARVLRPGGYYLLSLAGLDDGYYKQFVTSSGSRPNYIVDPANGIPSLLYSYDDVSTDFSSWLDLIDYEHKRKEGVMHGVNYERSTLVFYFQRKASIEEEIA